MRYKGQSYEIIVPFKDSYIEDFHRLHEKNYGYCNHDKSVEIVNLRLRARGITPKPTFKKSRVSYEHPSDEAYLGEKEASFDYQSIRTPILNREKLVSGNKISGPAIIVEYSSTIVVPPFANVCVDRYGNLIIGIRSNG